MASCFECGKKIASSAYRCPYCRTSISSESRKANEQSDGIFYRPDPLDKLAPYFDNILHFVTLATAVSAIAYLIVIYTWAQSKGVYDDFVWISAFFVWGTSYFISGFVVGDFVSSPTKRDVAYGGASNKPSRSDLRKALILSVAVSVIPASIAYFLCTSFYG